ncbi:MAG: ArsR/SmtB family transcription factor [Mycobacteriales bacterium]
MALSTPEIAVAKADMFRALAHPTRIRVLEVLVDGEQSVGALAEALDLDLPPLSQQLAVLRNAHIVFTRREGSMVFYRLADPRMSQLFVTAKQLLATDLRSGRQLLDSLEVLLVDGRS